MSEPIGNSISTELISSMSALNTEVTYDGPKIKDDELVFISDAEPLAAHSMEHTRAAFDISNELKENLSELKGFIYKTLKDNGKELSFNQWASIDSKFRKIERRL